MSYTLILTKFLRNHDWHDSLKTPTTISLESPGTQFAIFLRRSTFTSSKGLEMLNLFKKLLKNTTFLMFMNIVIAETVITATFVYFNQVPSEGILSTNLVEVIKVFEG